MFLPQKHQKSLAKNSFGSVARTEADVNRATIERRREKRAINSGALTQVDLDTGQEGYDCPSGNYTPFSWDDTSSGGKEVVTMDPQAALEDGQRDVCRSPVESRVVIPFWGSRTCLGSR